MKERQITPNRFGQADQLAFMASRPFRIWQLRATPRPRTGWLAASARREWERRSSSKRTVEFDRTSTSTNILMRLLQSNAMAQHGLNLREVLRGNKIGIEDLEVIYSPFFEA